MIMVQPGHIYCEVCGEPFYEPGDHSCIDKLRAIIESRGAEIETALAWHTAATSRADAAEARVKELEDDLHRLIRHRKEPETGDEVIEWLDKLIEKDTKRTDDRIAALELELAEAKKELRGVADDYQDIGRELYTELKENERLRFTVDALFMGHTGRVSGTGEAWVLSGDDSEPRFYHSLDEAVDALMAEREE